MGNLRIKLKYKDFEIELEGEKDTVQSEFKDIKENGLGNVISGVDLSESTYIVESNKEFPRLDVAEVVPFQESDIPSLKDVIMKQLPSSEREWILVYAYYSSDFGTKSFTNKSILDSYESSKRKTTSRHANMSGNIKALFTKGYFSALNDDDFILTDDGKHQANEILSRTHSAPLKQAKPKKKPSAKKSPVNQTSAAAKKGKSKATSQKYEVLKDLNLRPAGKKSIMEYIKDYSISSNADRIIVVVEYLKDVLELDKVTINHLYTAFFVLKCRIPASFYQVVINTKSRSKLIDFSHVGDISLSAIGLNRVRFDIKKSSEA